MPRKPKPPPKPRATPGPKPVAPGDPRVHNIATKVSLAERDLLARGAAASGRKVSDLLRSGGLELARKALESAKLRESA